MTTSSIVSHAQVNSIINILVYFSSYRHFHTYVKTQLMFFHRRSKNTCFGEKVRFLYLWQYGYSIKTIATLSGRSPTTVRKWVRHLLEDSLHPTLPPPHFSTHPDFASRHVLPYPYESPCSCRNQLYVQKSLMENNHVDFRHTICSLQSSAASLSSYFYQHVKDYQ